MKFCPLLKLPHTQDTTIISLYMEVLQTFTRSEGIKDFTEIYLAETQAKQANRKVTKILSALWETFAQRASRVRDFFGWLVGGGGEVLGFFCGFFFFLLYLVTIPFSQRCSIPHACYSAPG